MSSKYLNDRYDIEGTRLRPEGNDRDRALVDNLRGLGVSGSVYHLIEVIPDQFEDTYVIMVDDRLIVRFELRRVSGASPEEVQTETLRIIGDGSVREKLE